MSIEEWIIIIIVLIFDLFLRFYFTKYMEEKGKNLATKEDIKVITIKTEEVKIQFQKELEDYKYHLETAVNKLNTANERALHISKTQYDKEFEIYLEIWQSLYDFIVRTLKLYPNNDQIPTDKNKKDKLMSERYDNYCDSYNRYSNIINRYAPFYNKEFNEKFNEIRKLCDEIGEIFNYYNYVIKYNAAYIGDRNLDLTPEEKKKVYIILPKEIEKLSVEIQENIRDYLYNLRVDY